MSLQLWGRHSLYLTILRIFRGCYSSFDFVFVRKVSSVGFFAWIIFSKVVNVVSLMLQK